MCKNSKKWLKFCLKGWKSAGFITCAVWNCEAVGRWVSAPFNYEAQRIEQNISMNGFCSPFHLMKCVTNAVWNKRFSLGISSTWQRSQTSDCPDNFCLHNYLSNIVSNICILLLLDFLRRYSKHACSSFLCKFIWCRSQNKRFKTHLCSLLFQ